MVGDSATGIKTARAAGLPAFPVDFGDTGVPVAEFGPDWMIRHFDELMEACGALMWDGGSAKIAVVPRRRPQRVKSDPLLSFPISPVRAKNATKRS